VAHSCEQGNEHLGFIKLWKFLEKLHSWQSLKKGLTPWSQILKAVVKDQILRV
jgi:hypothetical protein